MPAFHCLTIRSKLSRVKDKERERGKGEKKKKPKYRVKKRKVHIYVHPVMNIFHRHRPSNLFHPLFSLLFTDV